MEAILAAQSISRPYDDALRIARHHFVRDRLAVPIQLGVINPVVPCHDQLAEERLEVAETLRRAPGLRFEVPERPLAVRPPSAKEAAVRPRFVLAHASASPPNSELCPIRPA